MSDTWTKQPPTLPGWYWHSKCSWRDNEGPFAVLVEYDCGDGHGVLVGWVPLMDYTARLTDGDDSWPGEWFGPIETPKLPVQFKRGDVTGYVYAQPGNDTTYLVLTEVRQSDCSALDVLFDMPLKSVKLASLWHASETELDSTVAVANSTFTVRQLAEKAIRNMGMTPNVRGMRRGTD